MKILVSGVAGFIGYHLALRLVERGVEVLGLDNINNYYDVRIKHGRLAELGILVSEVDPREVIASTNYPNLRFVRMDLLDARGLQDLFVSEHFDRVCNLAAFDFPWRSMTDRFQNSLVGVGTMQQKKEGCELTIPAATPL